MPALGAVASGGQYPAQVENRLGVDVLVRGRLDEDALRPGAEDKLAVVMLGHRTYGLEQRHHGVPLDVVADRMLKDLVQRGAVVVAEVHRLRAVTFTAPFGGLRPAEGSAPDPETLSDSTQAAR